MQKLQLDFQGAMNRLNEEQSSINMESAKMCFAFKKAHKLDPGSNYLLDEWKGQLVKQ